METRGLLLAACVVAAPGVCGCAQDGPLSDAEMTSLRQFTLVPLPADPTNAHADDPAAAVLGKQLFFDTRFAGALGPYNEQFGVDGALGASGDTGKVGCVSCHDPNNGGSDHRSLPDATSLGAAYTSRNAATVINAAYSPVWQFWDGRADSLWSQALSPPEGQDEGNGTRLAIAHFIADHYRASYEAVFGPMPDTSALPATGRPMQASFDGLSAADQTTVNTIYSNFGKAIAAYERRLVSSAFEPSPLDRFLAGDESALSPQAIAGARLFIGHAGCTECHRGPMLTDYDFHNIGTPQAGEYVPSIDTGRADRYMPLANNLFNRAGAFSDGPQANEPSYMPELVAENANPAPVIGQFKTPSLRNVAKTAPYMHDGYYQSLWDVVNHYDFGGSTGAYSGQKDPAISPLMLSDDDLSALVAFLSALSDGGPSMTSDQIRDFPEGLTTSPALPK
jgi:cytochrome c peroxidase